jgi:mRNA interferase RelE/StbE
MYAIVFSQTAEKQFHKLNQEIQSRIISALDRIKVRPYDYLKKLVGYQYYRLRVGHYRIIVDIQDKLLIIFVIELGHRKDIYK